MSNPLLFLATLLLFTISVSHSHEAHQSNQADLNITENYPPPPFSSEFGGNFTLTNHHGKKSGNSNFHGQYILLYFGYTDCADICPVGLHAAGRALKIMGEDGKEIQPLFVNLDHNMTSLSKMQQYIQQFHPRFVGLTGSKQEIYQAAELYDVRYRYINKGEQTPLLVHSGKIFFHGRDGKVLTYFPHEASAEWLAAEMTRLILKDKNASSQ